MVNNNKLRGRIVEKGLSIGKVAEDIGLSASTLGRKLRGIADMTLREAEMLCHVLDIPKNEILNYFFVQEG